MMYIVVKIFELWSWAIVIRAVLTWVPYNESLKGVYDFLDKVTDPIFNFIKRLAGDRLIVGNVDLTPMAAYFLLYLVRLLLIRVSI